MPETTDATPTRAERRIIRALSDFEWHPESELGSSFSFLQGMYLRGILEGAMMHLGNTPDDRLWRLRQ